MSRVDHKLFPLSFSCLAHSSPSRITGLQFFLPLMISECPSSEKFSPNSKVWVCFPSQVIALYTYKKLLHNSLSLIHPTLGQESILSGFPQSLGLNSGEGNGTPLQHSCPKYPMDGGAWWAAVHGVVKSRTRLSDFTFTCHFPALEKETATHSSVPAWRIPGMGEPGGLLSVGSHWVRHN